MPCAREGASLELGAATPSSACGACGTMPWTKPLNLFVTARARAPLCKHSTHTALCKARGKGGEQGRGRRRRRRKGGGDGGCTLSGPMSVCQEAAYMATMYSPSQESSVPGGRRGGRTSVCRLPLCGCDTVSVTIRLSRWPKLNLEAPQKEGSGTGNSPPRPPPHYHSAT